MKIIKFIADYSGYILVFSILWVVFVELIKRHQIKVCDTLDEKTIRRKITRSYLFGLSYSSFILIMVNIVIASSAIATYTETAAANKILNRPYIAVNTSGLEALKTGKIKSDLDNLSDQLIEKHLEFTIQNSGNSPAAFWVDLSDFIEPGVKNFIPQENSYGIIFPGESKEIRYLLEIESHFPNLSKEKEEMKRYIEMEKAVIDGEKDYLSRIVIYYDYLDNKNEGNFKTLIDQRVPRTGFSRNEVVRMDGYSSVWVTSFDSN